MCLALVALGVRSDLPLVIAANRDEFKHRPSLKAARWGDCPAIYGGRDLEKGGTWMAVHDDGRWGLVTNIRKPDFNRPEARSRGELVGNYLKSGLGPDTFLENLENSAEFNPFNLLLGHGTKVWHFNSLHGKPTQLEPGIHGLSNDTLNTPWPKVSASTQQLAVLMAQPSLSNDEIFEILTDRTVYPDRILPQTGVPIEWERILSAAFIDTPNYGTRCTTLAVLDNHNNWKLEERVWG